MSLTKPTTLEETIRCGKLKSYLTRYLKSCRPPEGTESKRPTGRFPNLAGFCRWLGCGISEAEALKLSHPAEADYLQAVMEDEALNSPLLSPTVMGAYLKRRLGYGEKVNAVSQTECGELQVIFEHDIGEDGA